MENEKIKCPWCNSFFSRNKIFCHMVKNCKYKKKMNEEELIRTIIKTMCGENGDNEIIKDYENLFSLPDLQKKYHLSYRAIQRLLKVCNIKIRNISDSGKLISALKHKKICNEKYGVDNISQLKEIKEKKKKTFLTHYGVDNIWKSEEFKDFSRQLWNSYTTEEKNKRLLGLIQNRKYGRISNLENYVLNVLREMGINYETQFKFNNYFHKYDAKLSNTKIILEINGDFWHANPNVYSENDILNFSQTNHPKAKDIWDKDKKNKEYAEKKGYKVITIWESEIKKKNDIELMEFLLNKINE